MQCCDFLDLEELLLYSVQKLLFKIDILLEHYLQFII